MIYANAHPDSTITLLPGIYSLAILPASLAIPLTLDPTSGSLKILANTRIVGPATIDGGSLDNVLSIGSGATVLMKDLTIRNGYLAIGSGGGIQNNGSLTLMHCMVTNNRADTGGGIANWPSAYLTLSDGSVVSSNIAKYSGGGVAGNVTVIDSTIRENYAPIGGGIDGGATIIGSTINNNTAEYGSAIRNFYDFAGPLAITNSTISGNKGNGAVIHVGRLARFVSVTIVGNGGGLNTVTHLPHQEIFSSMLVLRNTILANNVKNCDEGDIRSDDYNLATDTSCKFTQQHDQQGVDAMLGPLTDNGGPTLTHAPLIGSPALATGKCFDNFLSQPIRVDQRGMTRPTDAPCDIGAYEHMPT